MTRLRCCNSTFSDVNGMEVIAFGLDNLTYAAQEPAWFFGFTGGLIALG